jgi:hypothetical protein
MRQIRRTLVLTIAMLGLVPILSSTVIASTNNDNETLSITGNDKTAALALKAVEENGDTNKIDDFELTADNVLQIERGDGARITNDVDFDKARTTDINNNKKDIRIDDNGNLDFSTYPQGTYILQVITENGDRKLFEGIVAVGPQNEQQVKQQIQKTIVETIIDIEIVFEEPECSDNEGSAGLNYPYDGKSECEVEEYQQCLLDNKNGLPDTEECDTIKEGFSDDCEGFANSDECDAYFDDRDKFCQENPYHDQCPKELPYDELTPTPPLTPEITPQLTPELTPPVQSLVPPTECPEGSRLLDYPQTGCEPIDIENEELPSTPEPTPPISEIPNELGLTELTNNEESTETTNNDEEEVKEEVVDDSEVEQEEEEEPEETEEVETEEEETTEE